MTKTPVEIGSDDFDFGFSTISEIDLKNRENALIDYVHAQVTQTAEQKVQKMYNMIVPLLNNLQKDADKNEYIFWPDRAAKIEEFKQRLAAIL